MRYAQMLQISKLDVSSVSKKMFITQFKFQDKIQSRSGDLKYTCSEGHCYFHTAQKIKFCIKDFFSKCDQIRRKLRIWSHLLKKSLMENFNFLCSNVWMIMHLQGIENLESIIDFREWFRRNCSARVNISLSMACSKHALQKIFITVYQVPWHSWLLRKIFLFDI